MTEKPCEKNNIEILKSDLKSFYDQLIDRRKVITSQAQNLTGFTGIIQTILIGLIVALVTDKDTQTLIQALPNFDLLKILLLSGFTSYTITILFSLVAFWEWKVKLIPQIGESDTLKSYKEKAQYYSGKSNEYNTEAIKQIIINQYGVAIDELIKTNNRKYSLLIFSLIFLVIGIISTIIAGITILSLKIDIEGIDLIGVWLPLASGLIIGLIYVIISFSKQRRKLK